MRLQKPRASPSFTCPGECGKPRGIVLSLHLIFLSHALLLCVRSNSLLNFKMDGRNSCFSDTKAKTFSKQVTRAEAHGRPSGFRDLATDGNERFYQYNEAIPEACRTAQYAAYIHEKYPWIKGIMGYRVINHLPQDGDITKFEVPSSTKSGKFVLHWFWRGYYDCTDVNVVASNKKVTDMWGKGSGGATYTKRDHCLFWPQAKQCVHGDVCGSLYHNRRTRAAEARDKAQKNRANAVPGRTQKSKEYYALLRKQNSLAAVKNRATAAKEKAQKTQEPLDKAAKELKQKYDAALRAQKTGNAKLNQAEKAEQEAAKAYKASIKPLKGALKAFNLAKTAWNNADNEYKRMVHTLEWGSQSLICELIPRGTQDMSECQRQCSAQGCTNLQVVPFAKPEGSAFDAPALPQVCKNHPNLVNATAGDHVCFALREGRPNDSGAAYDVAEDPEDPVFYSTCFTRQAAADTEFKGNTCGKPCQLEQDNFQPPWRYGDRCISCDLAQKNFAANSSFAPGWALQPDGGCRRCQ